MPEELTNETIKSFGATIQNIRLCYTQKSTNPVNQLCLDIATAISPPIITEEDIEALEPNTGPYCLLMPTIKQWEDVYGTNIHAFRLGEIIISECGRVCIPIAACLTLASVSDKGLLRHLVSIDGNYPELTPDEIRRISQHSKQAKELYEAVIRLNNKRILGEDIGAKLLQLANALRAGGVAARAKAKTVDEVEEVTQYNSGCAANIGIIDFHQY